MSAKYWIGTRPSKACRWSDAEHGTEINDPDLLERIRQMHSRYVKTWNDVELDMARHLSEHLENFHGAVYYGGYLDGPVLGMTFSEGDRFGWRLEIKHTRSFRAYHPGWSFGKNPLRSLADMKSVRLHWAGDGDDRFLAWLDSEREAHQHIQGETQYR